LKLPAEVQLGLRDKSVDMGHARALLSLDKATQQLKLYNEIMKKGLSVRQVETRVKELKQEENGESPAKPAAKPANKADFSVLTNHLTKSFGVNVKFDCNNDGKGRITFPFKNEEELQRLIGIFDKIK
jgi:hypothetical protein